MPLRLWNEIGTTYGSAAVKRRFALLMRAARTRTVRLLEEGDSRTTSPTGQGTVLCAAKTAAMRRHYRNLPETPYGFPSNYGGGIPGAHVVWRCTVIGGATSTEFTSQMGFAGWTARSLSETAAQGAMFFLEPFGEDIPRGARLNGSVFWDITTPVECTFLFARKPTSSGAIIQSLRRNDFVLSWFSGTLVDTTNVDAASLTGPAGGVVAITTPPMSLSGDKYPFWRVRSDGANQADLIGAIARVPQKKHGVVIHWAGAGGYTAASHAANHGSVANLARVMGFDAIGMRCDYNDANNNVTAVQFQADLLAWIAARRAQLNRPDLPVYIELPHECLYLSAPKKAEFDEYAGAAANVADIDGNTLVINTRLAVESAGVTAAEHDATGMVDRGNHANSTAYTTSEFVASGTVAPLYFRCMLNHTSAADGTDAPLTGLGHGKWRPLWFYTSPTDGVHPSGQGSRTVGDEFVRILTSLESTLDEEAASMSGANDLVQIRTTVNGATWVPVAAARTVLSGRLLIPSGNANPVEIRVDGGAGVTWPAGSQFDVQRIDLSGIEVRGTGTTDVVLFAGGNWPINS